MDDLLRALGRDRGRLPRLVAQAAAALLLVCCVSLFADWIIQQRTDAVTHTSFTAARSQLGRLLESRTDTFTALSDLSYVVPVLRDAAASVDQADFGLGDPADDRAHLQETHDNLASADFVTFARAAQGAEFGVADYKGRLLFASAEPTRWGDDVRALPAIAAAYAVSAEAPQAAVVRGDDPALVASGLLGNLPRPGLQVLFARATPTEGRPRALFVQLLPGSHLLGELALGEGTEMALVAPDGTIEGKVPRAVVEAGLRAGDGVEEVERDGARWMVQRYPLTSPGSGERIAEIVLARRADVGLAGLFPGARTVLAIASLILAGLVIGGLVEARRRDLTRS